MFSFMDLKPHQSSSYFDKNFENMTQSALLGCAVGDALGAGIEFWSLDDIVKIFKTSRDVEYTRMLLKDKPNPIYAAGGEPGDVTDDTTMTLCVMMGLTKAMEKILNTEEKISKELLQQFQKQALTDIFQAFLFWGQYQDFYPDENAEDCKKFLIDQTWANLNVFKDVKGMGKGVLNILRHGRMGTLEHLPEIISDDKSKPSKGKYSKGCGALMRLLPIGLVCSQLRMVDPFEFGCRSGAITHGDAASYLSAGIMAELIVEMITNKSSLSQSLVFIKNKLKERMQNELTIAEKQGYVACLQAISSAMATLNAKGDYDIDTLDKLGLSLGPKESLFTTPPVFAQALFVALAAEKHGWTNATALKFAVTQSGDSDSVGAIVGGLLGVMRGKQASLPDDLVNGLNNKQNRALKQISNDFTNTLKKVVNKLQMLKFESFESNEEEKFFKLKKL